jgi:hypothetical protein
LRDILPLVEILCKKPNKQKCVFYFIPPFIMLQELFLFFWQMSLRRGTILKTELIIETHGLKLERV